jgi:anti-sigma B factor antagonist
MRHDRPSVLGDGAFDVRRHGVPYGRAVRHVRRVVRELAQSANPRARAPRSAIARELVGNDCGNLRHGSEYRLIDFCDVGDRRCRGCARDRDHRRCGHSQMASPRLGFPIAPAALPACQGSGALLPYGGLFRRSPLTHGGRGRLRNAEYGNVCRVASGLEIEPLPDARGMRLTGDLDFSTAPQLTEAVSAFAPGDELHLELAELILVDSAGLHALLGLARTRANRSLILLDPPASVMRSFEIAGIDKHPAIEIRQVDASSVPRRTRKTSTSLRRAG